jgi:hypothetical protein
VELGADPDARLHHCRLRAHRDRVWFNPSQIEDAPAGATNWFTIGAVVLSLLVGATVLTASIAFSFQRYFEYQIEEGRKISQ